MFRIPVICAKSPFYIINRSREQKRPDKAGENIFDKMNDHGFVDLEQFEEIAQFYFFVFLLLHDMLFLYHEPADDGDDGGNRYGDQCQNHERGIITSDHLVNGDRDGGHAGTNHGEHHHPEPGSDDQLRPFIDVVRHGPVQKVSVIEGSADVIKKIEKNDPDGYKDGVTCNARGH